ncbi:MAG TPA: hypothetical protein PLE54_18155 [Burkholderiaceae bacterium]|nr:hypothetical protein [Burkholderiaceae bacterium]HQR72534.1 hypothetical protein [Burkholderiaceae bacterium]
MSAEAPSPVPTSREFTLLGITYGLFAIGLVMFWPAFIGLVVAYVKRGDVAENFLASHYSWLIRTFWGWTLGFAAGLGIILALVVPTAIRMERMGDVTATAVRVPWELLGGAVAGGLIFLLVWCWVVYRLIRGTLRLADGREVP